MITHSPTPSLTPVQVLFVEDQEDTRLATTLALRARGFTVMNPRNLDEARRAMASNAANLGVCVFDMWLGEPGPWGASGADLAVELREKYGASGVEVLAWSAFQDFDYVTGAVRARAAAYLSKSGSDMADLVRHVRVLGIRWLLRQAAETSELALARAARGTTDLVSQYAQRVVVPALDRCLGTPFALVLTCDVPDGTTVLGSWGPLGERFQVRQPAPMALTHREPRSWPHNGTTHAVAPLVRRGAAGLVVVMEQVPRGEGESVTAESVKPLAELLSRFLPETIHEGLGQAERAFQYLREIRMASCLTALSHSGVEHARQILPSEDVCPENGAGLRALDALSARLKHGADMLQDLAWETEAKVDVQEDASTRPSTTCRAMLGNALSQLSVPEQDIDSSFDGDGTILTGGGDIAWSVATLLQWFVDRSGRTPLRRCKLSFGCKERAGRVEVTIEDESDRAPEPVRGMLFEPGAVSVTTSRERGGYGDDVALYVARMVLDWRHRCEVRDETEAREGDKGHRFVLSFPQSTPQLPAT
jgi:DNA-binding NarL/FixJ family response regulator